jgi:hypothetical protein
MSSLGEELERMDKQYIWSLANDIKWLVGYEGRNRYNTLPSFKSAVKALSNELTKCKMEYKKEWGRSI